MRSYPFILLTAGLALAGFGRANARPMTDTLNHPQELRTRGGLPNFFAKVRSGQPLTVAYLGGSITEAGGGWREQTWHWLQEQHPGNVIRQVNAGVGGTGSDLGVFRLKHDVLYQPVDLVFVEFAVNDGSLAPGRIHETMEGIVRQIWRASPRADICFVYTLSGNMVPTLQRDSLWPSMRAMEDIAQHYQIPTVQFGPEVLKELAQGTLVFQGDPKNAPAGKRVFSQDNVHPLPQTGHQIYAGVLERSLPKLMAGRPGAHQLGKPYTKSNWEKAQMLPVTVLKKNGAWQELSDQDSVAKNFRGRFPVTLKATEAGAALSLRFKGTVAGLYDIIGPGCGQYLVAKDDSVGRLVPRFDAFAWYYRTNYFLLPFNKLKDHRVSWTLSATPVDKRAVLKPMGHDALPANRYGENAVYAGWLLLVGDLK